MAIPITRIVEHLEGELEGDASLSLVGMAEFEKAGEAHICFAESTKYLEVAASSRAGALIVPRDFPTQAGKSMIRVDRPRDAFIRALELFAPDLSFQGVHPTACVDSTAVLGTGVGVGPYVVIEDGVVIADGACIRAGAFIGAGVSVGENSDIGANVSILRGCKIGARCLLHPGVCIGADGYGFRWQGDHHHKIPQLGTVIVGDDVEIGANSCIDRATLGETRIGDGTKLDNLVHIAHNNEVGEHVIMAAMVGVAGSCRLGDKVVLAGRAGVIDHIMIGEAAQVMADALVTRDVKAGETVWGLPARPIKQAMKQIAELTRLPRLLGGLRRRERELEDLRARLDELEKKFAD